MVELLACSSQPAGRGVTAIDGSLHSAALRLGLGLEGLDQAGVGEVLPCADHEADTPVGFTDGGIHAREVEALLPTLSCPPPLYAD